MESRKNYIAPMERLFAEYGDFIYFHGFRDVCMVFNADAVEHVLKTNQKNYLKADDMKELRPVLGNGLLTSEGEEWRSNRRLMAPEFQHKNLQNFYGVISEHAEAMLKEWRGFIEVTDLAPALSKATYGIAGECFFGTNLESSSKVVYDGIEASSEVAIRRMMSIFRPSYKWPFPSHLKMNRAVAAMDKVVYGIIDDRLAHPKAGEDVLSRLIKAGGLSRTQMRDEVMTLLLAGHETTANSLAWTLYLLGKHPDIQEKLRDEVTAAMAGEVPTMPELTKMPYAKMVLEESMRLIPPVAAIGRQNIEADELGGHPIKPDTKVNLVQWVIHRHPKYWDKPLEFIPERFADKSKHHPYAYFPFGGGARVCVGEHMAMMEGVALLATMIRNFRFQLARDDVKPRPLITVRPDPGLFMKLEPVQASRRLRPESNLSH
jgi:cytochrome P450